MRRRRPYHAARGRRPLVALLALALPLAAITAGAAEAPTQEVAERREAELEEIRGEIARMQSRLSRLRDETVGVAGAVERSALEVELQEKRVEEVRAELALVETVVAESEQRVSQLEARLAEARSVLRQRLIELYRLGRAGSLRLLLSIRSERQLLPGLRLLRYMARREASAVDEVMESRVRLAFERDELVERRQQMAALERREAERLTALERLQARQESMLVELSRERDAVTARTERLIDKERKLANLLALLYGRNATPLAGTPIQEFNGVLDWPVEGRVVAGFGPRMDPRYGTRVPHNGLDIATAAGGDVRVVFPGRVLFAAPFQGYGLTVVVNHPRRVFTLYAGLRELRTRPDAMLSLGQPVGIAGDRLYFEIRVENRPVDPVDWLR